MRTGRDAARTTALETKHWGNQRGTKMILEDIKTSLHFIRQHFQNEIIVHQFNLDGKHMDPQ